MKRLIVCLGIFVVVVVSLIGHPAPSEAKGPAQKISVLGPGLSEELEILDPEILPDLSMASFENFLQAVPAPENIGPGYAMTRYYQIENGPFWPFDHLVYHPDPSGGLGVIHYLGIENGWSEYDGKWFAAQPQGEKVFASVLAEQGVTLDNYLHPAEPYLILAEGTGTIHFVNPDTLDDAGRLSAWEEWHSISQASTTLDGRTLLFSMVTPTSWLYQLAFDLPASANCQLTQQSQIVMPTYDGYVLVENAASVATRGDIGGERQFEIRDANTFELQETVALPNTYEYHQYFPSPDKRWLYALQFDDSGAVLHVFDVYTREFVKELAIREPIPDAEYRGVWEPDTTRFYLIDGQRLFVINTRDHTMITVGRPPELRDSEGNSLTASGTPLEIAGVHDGQLYLYHRLGRYWLYNFEAEKRGEINKGLIVVSTRNAKQVDHLQPELDFSQVVMSNGQFYALRAPQNTGDAALLAIDLAGSITASRELPSDSLFLAPAWFAPDAMPDGTQPGITSSCAGLEQAFEPLIGVTPTPQ